LAKLEWNSFGEKYFEAGLDRGVLYSTDGVGVAWNGLVSINETPSGAELSSYYVDGVKVLEVLDYEEYKATISAYTYPFEFEKHDGYISEAKEFFPNLTEGLSISSQERLSFGLCYRTYLGNDVSNFEHGYKIHLIYNAIATPSTRNNTTLNSTISPELFSWDLSTTPLVASYVKRQTSHVIIDSTKTEPKLLSAIEEVLYGKYDTAPRLPSPDQLFNYFDGEYVFKVVDHMDGTYSVISTDQYVSYLNDTTFQLSKTSVVSIDSNSFEVSSS
jgi:hypothetical protein